MVKLESLLETKITKFVVEKEDYYDFLVYVKTSGCVWQQGKIIHPKEDNNKYGNSRRLVAITKDKLVYHPYGTFANMSIQGFPKYNFKDVKEDIKKDLNFEEEYKIRKSIEEKEKAYLEEKARFKRHIEHLKQINQKQLKYQEYTRSLPKQFFVKYNDKNELIELFNILDKYGYENYFNINPIYFDEKPQVLCVDNRGMTFSPTNTTCCACAVTAGIKFYTYEEFVPMIKRIFDENKNDVPK